MDTRTKLLLDSAVAVPAAWGLNACARGLGVLLRRDHRVNPGHVKHVVIAKLLGMGSIVQATVLLNAVRSGFPNARITFVTTRANKDLVERLPQVDEGIYLDDRSPKGLVRDGARTWAKLVGRPIDLYFDLEVYSAAAATLALVSLAKNRIGFYRHSARFKKGNFTHLAFFNMRLPISELYMQLYRVAGGPNIETPPLGPIALREVDRSGAKSNLARLGVTGQRPYVVLNPNASDLLTERRWPLDRFASVAKTFAERGYDVVLIGAPSERAYVEGAMPTEPSGPGVGPVVVNAAGSVTLGQLFAVLEGAACVVTNDTGPMHLAIALRTPTVCLFGPGSPDHYGVFRDDVAILYQPVICSPCIYETDVPPCGGNNVCMQLITPAAVVEAALRLLASGRLPLDAAPRKAAAPSLQVVDDKGRALGVFVRHSAPPS